MPEITSLEAFKAAARRDEPPEGVVVRQGFASEVRAADQVARTIDFVISTETVDRSSDVIYAKGWQLDNFKRNPVVLFAHDSSAPPIARAISVGVDGKTLKATAQFADADTYAFADTIYRLLLGKFLSATSVGFIPLRYEFIDDDSKRMWGMDILESELLEFSIVPIPCNPDALIAAAASGIDVKQLRDWAGKVLDDGSQIMVPRAHLEGLYKAARVPPRDRLTGKRSAPMKIKDDNNDMTDDVKPPAKKDDDINVTENAVSGPSDAQSDDKPGPAVAPGPESGGGNSTGGPSGAQTDLNPGVKDGEGDMGASGEGSGKPGPDDSDDDTLEASKGIAVRLRELEAAQAVLATV